MTEKGYYTLEEIEAEYPISDEAKAAADAEIPAHSDLHALTRAYTALPTPLVWLRLGSSRGIGFRLR